MNTHPDSSVQPKNEEITLRCNRCGKPITPSEAIQTPTGYRCQDCIRNQQKVFDTSHPLDAVWGLLIAAGISLAGSFLTRVIGFFTFLLAPAAGVAIAEMVRVVVRKRRGKRLFKAVTIGAILGGVPFLLMSFLNFVASLGSGSFHLFSLLPLGYQILYLVLAVPSAYYRLSGKRR